jgi:rhodanese-related sulfurtransferase
MLAAVLVFTGCATTQSVSGPFTTDQMVAQAKATVPELTVAQAKMNIDKRSYKVILDVREPNEFRAGHIPGAMNVPRGLLEFQVSGKVPDKSAPLLVYCKTGGRGALAGQTLQNMGYKNVTNMDGGWVGWEKAGYPVE